VLILNSVMHFQNTFIFLGTFITNVYAQTQVSVSYDQVYDNAAEPIANVACSNSFGSLTTLGQIPAFANVRTLSNLTCCIVTSTY